MPGSERGPWSLAQVAVCRSWGSSWGSGLGRPSARLGGFRVGLGQGMHVVEEQVPAFADVAVHGGPGLVGVAGDDGLEKLAMLAVGDLAVLGRQEQVQLDRR